MNRKRIIAHKYSSKSCKKLMNNIMSRCRRKFRCLMQTQMQMQMQMQNWKYVLCRRIMQMYMFYVDVLCRCRYRCIYLMQMQIYHIDASCRCKCKCRCFMVTQWTQKGLIFDISNICNQQRRTLSFFSSIREMHNFMNNE